MKILLLGNGFECIYNPEVRDFNKKLESFIKNKKSTTELIEKIGRFCPHSEKYYIDIIDEMRNNLGFTETFILENELYEIGTNLGRNGAGADIYYHCIKNIIGFLINEWTEKTNQKEIKKLRLKASEFPDEIWTTNYTRSAELLYENWKKIYDKSIYNNTRQNNMGFYHANNASTRNKVKYLHGKFNELDNQNFYTPHLNFDFRYQLQNSKTKNAIDDNTFQEIEINLQEKKWGELKKTIKWIKWWVFR